MTIPGRTLLLAMGRALGAVHVENDTFRAASVACTPSIQVPDRSVSASRLASVANHSVSKRPIWLLDAARTIETLTADDRPHRRIAGEAQGIVDILVAGEPTQHRLAEKPAQLVARVLATAAVEELRDRHVGEPKGVVQLAVGEKAAIRGDPCAVELELDPAVEGDPEARLFRFTRRVRHHAPV